MQGLHLLPQLNSSLQEDSRSHGSSSPWEEVQGHLEVNGAGTTWGHRGAPGWGWRRAHEGLPGPAHSKTRDRLDPDAVIGEIQLNSSKETREKQEAP